MVRTADSGYRVSGGKNSKKSASVSSGSGSSTSRSASSSSKPSWSGGNQACQRETPSWQKPITNFFIKNDKPISSIELQESRSSSVDNKGQVQDKTLPKKILETEEIHSSTSSIVNVDDEALETNLGTECLQKVSPKVTKSKDTLVNSTPKYGEKTEESDLATKSSKKNKGSISQKAQVKKKARNTKNMKTLQNISNSNLAMDLLELENPTKTALNTKSGQGAAVNSPSEMKDDLVETIADSSESKDKIEASSVNDSSKTDTTEGSGSYDTDEKENIESILTNEMNNGIDRNIVNSEPKSTIVGSSTVQIEQTHVTEESECPNTDEKENVDSNFSRTDDIKDSNKMKGEKRVSECDNFEQSSKKKKNKL